LPGFVLLGDAAGFTDPITGGGMTQALLSAELLSQYVARHARAAAEHWLGDFDREREALLRNYRRLTTLILWLTKHQASLRIALEAMRRLPKLFSHLLGVAGSAHQFENAEFKYGIAASQSQCLARTP
jgi:flavin-dependent dehydrogenase